MSKSGSLSGSEPLLGPFGTYFGRSLGEVRSELASWTVPGSGGTTVKVNRAALPAFRQVSVNLAKHATHGRVYRVNSVSAHTGRTINARRQLSRHALGLAIDINAAANPYRDDPSQLITDMPDWYVAAWADAGFCWGGGWRYSKDPMHFSWVGPPAGAGSGLTVRPPRGSMRAFEVSARFGTILGERVTEYPMLLADAAGFGALDVIRIRETAGGLVFDASGARAGFGSCSMFRWFVPIAPRPDSVAVMGDIDGDSRSDVVVLSPDGASTRVETASRVDTFKVVTSRSVESGSVNGAIADFDGDRRGDLWLFEGTSLSIWAGPGFESVISEQALPIDATAWAVADRDGDTQPEIFAFDHAANQVEARILAYGPGGWVESETADFSIPSPVAFSAADEDGDGRADIAVLDEGGALIVATGNASTGRPVDGWWNDPLYECDDELVPLEWTGAFFDDEESIFQDDIEWIAQSGITRGCNPPFNDEYCPEDTVTRGEMAAFLVRALSLPQTERDPFADDDDSVFEADIGALAAAGITRGCGTMSFCPGRAVSRGEMAAFLTRGLGLEKRTETDFVDDDDSVFEAEIESLAAAGITRGCNPPANDRFCPGDRVTREQMAAFLRRALQ